jgi:hypothetical protein
MATFDIRGTIVLVDDEDLELISKHSWFFTPQGYACTALRVAPGKKGRRTIGMHRLILGDPDTASIDHINRNKLDNRKENLRACTDSQNNRNRSILKGKKSIYRGVSPHRGNWQVVIRINGVLTWLGKYKTEDEAALIAAPYFSDIDA